MVANAWLAADESWEGVPMHEYALIVGGFRLGAVTHVHPARKEVRIDRCEANPREGRWPRPIMVNANAATADEMWGHERLAFPRATWWFGVPDPGEPSPAMIWWTGEGWIDKTGAPVEGGPPAVIQGG